MTIQAFEQFRTQVNADKALQASVAACFSSPPTEGSTGFDKLAALGKSHGFDFTAQDVQGRMGTGDATLSDFELELVSAGAPNMRLNKKDGGVDEQGEDGQWRSGR